MMSSSNVMIFTTTNIRKILTIIVVVVALAFRLDGVFSFQVTSRRSSPLRAHRSVTLFAENSSSSSENLRREDQQGGEEFLFGSGNDFEYVENFPSDDQIFSSFNRKIKELELGIGKRYIIRTQRGFLNVHYEVRMYCTI